MNNSGGYMTRFGWRSHAQDIAEANREVIRQVIREEKAKNNSFSKEVMDAIQSIHRTEQIVTSIAAELSEVKESINDSQ
jgi:TRAP-type mannitol/chloroaromatic compound transport system substrate-binding protein